MSPYGPSDIDPYAQQRQEAEQHAEHVRSGLRSAFEELLDELNNHQTRLLNWRDYAGKTLETYGDHPKLTQAIDFYDEVEERIGSLLEYLRKVLGNHRGDSHSRYR